MRDEISVLKVNKHVHESADDKFKVVPIYKVLDNNASVRDEKERYLINTLKSELNSSVESEYTLLLNERFLLCILNLHWFRRVVKWTHSVSLPLFL